jgi:hypothetical protein
MEAGTKDPRDLADLLGGIRTGTTNLSFIEIVRAR